MMQGFGKAVPLKSVADDAPAPPGRPEGSKFLYPDWAARSPDDVSTFLTVEKEGQVIDRIELTGRWAVVMGRNPSMADQLLEHPTISREHAALCYDGDGWRVCDLGSAQGTAFNGKEIEGFVWEQLTNGSKLSFAESTRTYVMHEAGKGSTASAPKRRLAGADAKPAKAAKTEIKVRCRHILVKHKNSRRPASWRSPEGITRSVDEARHTLEGFQLRLKKDPHLFGAIAGENSDCSSAAKQGDLGFFGRNKMQKPFESASFALQVGQMSDIVATDSGLHLILREA